MDDQLKRRLMGATIVTALAVIFVPMLFEDKSAGPSGGAPSEVPALPEPIEQRTIELPKSAADVAPAEGSVGKDTKRAPETGYRIVPLDDAPPKPAKPAPAAQAPTAQAELEVPPEEDLIGDEGGEAAEEQAPAKAAIPAPKPVVPDKAADAKAKAAPGKKPKTGASGPAAKAPEGEAPEADESPALGEEEAAPKAPPLKPKAIPAAGKPAEVPPKKPEKAKPGHVPPKPTAARPEPVKPAEPPATKTPVAKSAAAKPAPVAEPAEEVGAPPAARPSPAKSAMPAAPKPVPTEAAKPPVAPAPAKPAGRTVEAQPAEPPSAWVVQAGSFTGEANARALADKLRKQNLPAYVHVSHRESGDIYRVTVGPELNRARAEQIQKQIESTVGIKGMILPHR